MPKDKSQRRMSYFDIPYPIKGLGKKYAGLIVPGYPQDRLESDRYDTPFSFETFTKAFEICNEQILREKPLTDRRMRKIFSWFVSTHFEAASEEHKLRALLTAVRQESVESKRPVKKQKIEMERECNEHLRHEYFERAGTYPVILPPKYFPKAKRSKVALDAEPTMPGSANVSPNAESRGTRCRPNLSTPGSLASSLDGSSDSDTGSDSESSSEADVKPEGDLENDFYSASEAENNTAEARSSTDDLRGELSTPVEAEENEASSYRGSRADSSVSCDLGHVLAADLPWRMEVTQGREAFALPSTPEPLYYAAMPEPQTPIKIEGYPETFKRPVSHKRTHEEISNDIRDKSLSLPLRQASQRCETPHTFERQAVHMKFEDGVNDAGQVSEAKSCDIEGGLVEPAPALLSYPRTLRDQAADSHTMAARQQESDNSELNSSRSKVDQPAMQRRAKIWNYPAGRDPVADAYNLFRLYGPTEAFVVSASRNANTYHPFILCVTFCSRAYRNAAVWQLPFLVLEEKVLLNCKRMPANDAIMSQHPQIQRVPWNLVFNAAVLGRPAMQDEERLRLRLQGPELQAPSYAPEMPPPQRPAPLHTSHASNEAVMPDRRIQVILARRLSKSGRKKMKSVKLSRHLSNINTLAQRVLKHEGLRSSRKLVTMTTNAIKAALLRQSLDNLSNVYENAFNAAREALNRNAEVVAE